MDSSWLVSLKFIRHWLKYFCHNSDIKVRFLLARATQAPIFLSKLAWGDTQSKACVLFCDFVGACRKNKRRIDATNENTDGHQWFFPFV